MLKILKPGFYTTLQDLGRFGYRDKGVPVSGVMDNYTVSIINTLLENKKNAAVLEITMTGPTLEFDEETYICLGGAELSVTLNNQPIQNNKIYHILSGDILSYGKLEKGFRGYLAVKNGFLAPKILGSMSYYPPITAEKSLKSKSLIAYKSTNFFQPKIHELQTTSYIEETVLDVFKGPEYSILSDRQLEVLFFKNFSVAKENNRMAYQLNEQIEKHTISMLTSATLPGTVQLTPSGKLIILMKDGQTTGGYPRIMQLSEKAIAILSQKRFGDTISFKLI